MDYFRRAYATENCDRLPLPALKDNRLHKGIKTTMRYVEIARKMTKGAEDVYVPAFLRRMAACVYIECRQQKKDLRSQGRVASPYFIEVCKYTPRDSNAQPSVP